MKRFIVILSAFFCLSMAQDIAGSWTLTAVDVFYYNFARPNAATADPAFGEYQYQTPLYVNDTYGLGASLPLAWLPPGYMFLGVPNGPFGEGGLAANGVNLNVTLETDGTGSIPEGSTYPDIELDEDACVTFGQVLPVTDDIRYSSTADAGVTLPETNIVGLPSLNRYAGTEVGTMSLTQSVVFSFFPEAAAPDTSPIPLYFADGHLGTSMTPNADGMFETVGVTGGYIKTGGFDGSIGDNGPLSGGDNVDPDLALYWHTMDGFSADTGLGDDLALDEDGDGTPYDRIFGLPAISSTKIDPTFAADLGFGDDFGYHVFGGIQSALNDLLYAGCLEQVADGVTAQCEYAGGVAAFTFGQCVEQANGADFAAACAYAGVTAAVEGACIDAGGPATAEEAAAVGSPVTCGDLAAQYDLATGGDCAAAAGLASASCEDSNGSSLCCLASAIGNGSTDTDGDGVGECSAFTAGLSEEFLDGAAVAVLQATCTDYSAGAVAAYTEETTCDDYEDLDKVNQAYVMNPDPNYAPWSQFVTYNGYLYGLTGDPAYLVNDSGWDAEIVFVDANGDGVPDTPYSEMGGRLVFEYAPTCVPVLESMEVQTEFIGIAEGECTNDGDANSDGSVTVLDIVMIVQHVLGNALLTDAQACQADINSDASVTVLDIVVIVNQILNGRGEAATSAEFNRVGNALEMNANGVVDAVQITLSHGNDFSIELTDNALVADYSTKDNQTTLIIVSPEGNEIFTASGEYVIDSVEAANTNGFIETSMPVSFNLSEAYPNPFNPSTSLDITLSNEGIVSISAYNVMGQMVGTLHEGNMNAGSHTITWDASSLASGMYIIKAEVAGNIVNKKVMLLK